MYIVIVCKVTYKKCGGEIKLNQSKYDGPITYIAICFKNKINR